MSTKRPRKVVIGDCTLWQGDARDVLPQLANNGVDLVLTDPPYGHNNNNNDLIARRELALGRGTSGKARPIHNDGPEANSLFAWAIAEARRLLKAGWLLLLLLRRRRT